MAEATTIEIDQSDVDVAQAAEEADQLRAANAHLQRRVVILRAFCNKQTAELARLRASLAEYEPDTDGDPAAETEG